MYVVTENYKKSHNLSNQDFIKLDKKYSIVKYICECPDIFDSMTDEEMVKEIDYYLAA